MPLPANFVDSYGPWAVVTGASSGIGYEFCIQLAAAGLSIVLTARREERLEALSKRLRETYGVQTKVIVADLREEEGWRRVVNRTADLDVGLLVNNAGIEVMGPFARVPLERHMDVIALNVTAVTTLAHVFSNRLLDRGKGGIILVSSTASRPQPFVSTYGGSKAFVSTLGLILREELMPKGINVMVLEPMFVESEMIERAKKTVDMKKMIIPLITAATCVEEALVSFNVKKARNTPGIVNKLIFFVLGVLPTWITLKLFALA